MRRLFRSIPGAVRTTNRCYCKAKAELEKNWLRTLCIARVAAETGISWWWIASGFVGVQPSLLAILPFRPGCVLRSLSYLWNVKRDVGGGFGKVDPGDALRFTFGMGLALDERASFSVGYDHNTVFKTKQNGAVIATPRPRSSDCCFSEPRIGRGTRPST